MTSIDDTPRTLGERYVSSHGPDSDIGIAAGVAQVDNFLGAMGLTLYRASEDWRAHVAMIGRRDADEAVVRLLVNMVASSAPLLRMSEDDQDAATRCMEVLGIKGGKQVDEAEIRQVLASVRPAPPVPRTLPHDLLALHDWSVPELLAWSGRKGNTRLRADQASIVAETVIRWYLTGTCKVCRGRGYLLLPGTPIRSDTLCPDCNFEETSTGRVIQGMGRPPVERRLRKSLRVAGRWLASEFDTMVTQVLGRMAAALRPELDINMDRHPEILRRLVDLRSAEAQVD